MLNPLHEQAGAEFQPYAETPIVLTFGEPQAEYAAIRKAVAIMDWPQRGILELTGRDRLPFLNNLLTNQTFDKQTKQPLPAGHGIYAFFLNNKGRIVADMTVVELGDRTLLEMDGRMVDPIRQAFDKYLFTEQVKMTNRRDSLHEFFVTGPTVAAVLEQHLDPSPSSPSSGTPGEGRLLAPLQSLQSTLLGHPITLYRDDHCSVPGYILICPAEAAESIWRHFTSEPSAQPDQIQELRFRGLARPIGWAAFNATRIEAARPLFGIDFDDSILPAETGLMDRAVSLTKGCYLGQEIVARMHARGQIAKQLTGLRMSEDALPIAGTKIYDDANNEIGGITSSTISPILSNAAICLGYLKKAFLPEGTQVLIPAEGQMRKAIVSPGPFVK